MGSALNDNMFVGSPVNASPGYVDAYNSGRTAGHYLSMAIGATEVAAGAIGSAGAIAGEIGSVGLATPAAVVVGAGSVILAGHGLNTANNAVNNLKNDKGKVNADGPRNPDGAKGKPDHQAKVRDLQRKAREENPGQQIVTEKKIQTPGSNRRPDVQVIDAKTGKTTKVYEAERRPSSQRNIKREEEYNRLGIPNETHKVGNP